jgi:hypothetical protein
MRRWYRYYDKWIEGQPDFGQASPNVLFQEPPCTIFLGTRLLQVFTFYTKLGWSVDINFWRVFPWSPLHQRDYREGGPCWLLKQKQMGEYSTNERGPSLVCSLGSSSRYKRFLSCLGCSSRPSKKYFFLTVYHLNSFVPIASKLGLSHEMNLAFDDKSG